MVEVWQKARRRRRRRGGGAATDIKSNNPHLAGGEKWCNDLWPTILGRLSIDMQLIGPVLDGFD